jgi:CRP-like cAMP-binding protein
MVFSEMPSSKSNFDVKEFLANIGKGRKIVRVRKKERIYAQGAPCDALFYIQEGKVKLTVVSKTGKEATIAISGTSFPGVRSTHIHRRKCSRYRNGAGSAGRNYAAGRERTPYAS